MFRLKFESSSDRKIEKAASYAKSIVWELIVEKSLVDKSIAHKRLVDRAERTSEKSSN